MNSNTTIPRVPSWSGHSGQVFFGDTCLPQPLIMECLKIFNRYAIYEDIQQTRKNYKSESPASPGNTQGMTMSRKNLKKALRDLGLEHNHKELNRVLSDIDLHSRSSEDDSSHSSVAAAAAIATPSAITHRRASMITMPPKKKTKRKGDDVETVVIDSSHCIDDENDDRTKYVRFRDFCRIVRNVREAFLNGSEDESEIRERNIVDAWSCLGGNRDKTGKISSSKMKSLLGHFQLKFNVDDALNNLDVDGNGDVDFWEFEELFKEV